MTANVTIDGNGSVTINDGAGGSITITPSGELSMSNSTVGVSVSPDGSFSVTVDLPGGGQATITGTRDESGREMVTEANVNTGTYDFGPRSISVGVSGNFNWTPQGGARLSINGEPKIWGRDPKELADAVERVVKSSTTARILASRGEYIDDMIDAMCNGRAPMSQAQWFAARASQRAMDGENSLFMAALTWVFHHDPLALDLDGDGIETLGRNDTLLFDHSGKNVVNGTGWVKGDDGLLALDRNANGLIDSGAELFGVDTVMRNGQLASDGLAALRDFDLNQDGKIDSSDAVFSQLRVWKDADQDAVTDAGELISLTDLNITSISVVPVTATKDLGNGNRTTASATFTRADGSTGKAYNLDLAVNAFQRQYLDDVPVPADMLDLPNMAGSGRVRDLIQAAIRSPSLATALENFSQAGTREEQIALLKGVVDAWAGTSDMSTSVDSLLERSLNPENKTVVVYKIPGISYLTPTSLGLTFEVDSATQSAGSATSAYFSQLDMQNPEYLAWVGMLGVLEKFNGQTFINVPAATPINLELKVTSYTTDSDGTRNYGSPTMTGIRYFEVSLSSEQKALLEKSYAELLEAVYGTLVVQTRLKPYTDEIGIDFTTPKPTLTFAEMNALLVEKRSVDKVNGFIDLIELNRYAGKDLYPSGWNGMRDLQQWMQQYQGDADVSAVLSQMHVINAANGSIDGDLIVGNDLANTFSGNDGRDVIWGGAGNDTLNGDAGNDVLLGDAGNDILKGGNGSDLLMGGDGDDTLNGDSGGEINNCDDELLGGAGNDTLNGGAGSDVLEGGTGNDTLAGNTGNDIYIFSRGDGQDTISNSELYGSDDGIDKIVFKEGVNAADIRVNKDGSGGLVLLNAVTGDSVTVGAHFVSDQADDAYNQGYYKRYRIDFVEFADGTRWSVDDINSLYLAQHQTSADDTLKAFRWADTLQMGAGNDVVYGLGGDDIIDGGTGNDTVRGGTGADVLRGGDGNDTLYGDDGTQLGSEADQLFGGGGDDTLIGGYGDDLIVGGKGSDMLYGSQGADIYLFEAGDGVDTISSFNNGGLNPDTIRFGTGIAKEDFVLNRDGGLLVMVNTVTGDTIKINGQFASDSSTDTYSYDTTRYQRFDRFEFANGDVWTGDDINRIYLAQHQTAGNDTLLGFRWADTLQTGAGNDTVWGYAGDDVIDGGSGADVLRGGVGADTLLGGDGNDTLYGDDGSETGSTGADQMWGGAGDDTMTGGFGDDVLSGDDGADNINGGVGNDTIRGGAGADTLVGTSGNDRYLFGRGDGADTLTDNDTTAGNQDQLVFDASVTFDQLWFKRVGSNLEVSIIGTSDKVSITNWYYSSSYLVERMSMADGKYLDSSKVDQLVSAMASMTPPPAGQTSLTDAQHQQLDSVLAASWQS